MYDSISKHHYGQEFKKIFFKISFTPQDTADIEKKQVGIPYGNLLACSFERKRNFYLKMF